MSQEQTRPAFWGGVECTVNRIGDRQMDQNERTGHEAREGDLDLVAGDLGVRALRYPVLWERTTAKLNDPPRWEWSDRRLAHLRQLGITPIVGLLHHGSGPFGTSLEDPRLPALFAEYARAVADRYPWVELWNPVNEPATTSRFSGLYGYWYPHRKDEAAFARILVNQIRAVAAAMRAIRTVNPRAQLIQTEEVGEVRGRPGLATQIEKDNQRRWLSLDLLTGRVQADHPLHAWLIACGVSPADRADLCESPCPPDVIGVNHYLTSERYLDDRLELYPEAMHVGQDGRRYVDTDAVCSAAEPLLGPRASLARTHARYRIPVAITEMHLAGSEDDRIRWLLEIWDGAVEAGRQGVPVRSVTAWSVFGIIDWDSLATCWNGNYEPSLWDVSSGAPKPTAVLEIARALARGETPRPPALDSPGWWNTPARLERHPPVYEGHVAPCPP